MAMMIKAFASQAQAEKFAQEKAAKVTVHYEWDAMLHQIVKTYIVKF
jgi:pentose-5-phosphate-3-epimerase